MLQGNIQRCQQFVARLDEAHTTLLSITETHKQRVADIISRHQSKRIVKKKERLWTVLFYSRWVAAVLSSLPSDTDLCSTVCCAAHNMAPHCIISYRMLQSLRMEPPGGLGLRGWTSRAPHWNWNCALHWQVGNYVKIYWCPLVGSLAYAIQEHCQSAELLSNDSSHMCSLTVLYATCT